MIINKRLVASCWFLSLQPTFMMHGHKSLKKCSRYQTNKKSYKMLTVKPNENKSFEVKLVWFLSLNNFFFFLIFPLFNSLSILHVNWFSFSFLPHFSDYSEWRNRLHNAIVNTNTCTTSTSQVKIYLKSS